MTPFSGIASLALIARLTRLLQLIAVGFDPEAIVRLDAVVAGVTRRGRPICLHLKPKLVANRGREQGQRGANQVLDIDRLPDQGGRRAKVSSCRVSLALVRPGRRCTGKSRVTAASTLPSNPAPRSRRCPPECC